MCVRLTSPDNSDDPLEIRSDAVPGERERLLVLDKPLCSSMVGVQRSEDLGNLKR